MCLVSLPLSRHSDQGTDRCAGNAEAEEEEEDDNVPARRPQDRSVPRELEVDERGWPLLPDWSADWPLPLLKQLIRSFVTLCYRTFFRHMRMT